MTLEPKQVIEQWMLACVDEARTSQICDLHIDRIRRSWKRKETWIDNGLKALQIAFDLRKYHHLSFTVGLAVSLQAYNHKKGVDFKTIQELAHLLDWSPPSLYIFRRGDEPQFQIERALKDGTIDSDAISQKLDVASFKLETTMAIKGCYYLEFLRRSDAEYTRSVFIEG